MLRHFKRPRRPTPPVLWRCISSSSSSHVNQKAGDHIRSPPPALHKAVSPPPPSLSSSFSNSFLPKSIPFYAAAAAGALTSGVAVAVYLQYSLRSIDDHTQSGTEQLYPDLEQTLEKCKGSILRLLDRMVQTGNAATVLWKSLASVLSSANQEVRSGFELRVAALLADIAAASEARRSAIVGAGGGAVVDWLLESVAEPGNGGDHGGTQSESARALAHLIADPDVREKVLGRPNAITKLLRFILSFQPKRQTKQFRHVSFEGADLWRGKSMLVAVLMDIVTSNCDNIDNSMHKPSLPVNADIRDIAAALEVIEEGGMHFADNQGNEDGDDGNPGIKGLAIKILGGTTVLGFSRTDNRLSLTATDDLLDSTMFLTRTVEVQGSTSYLPNLGAVVPSAVPGLWDDLQREHVAVPFAAWALANWALASQCNRSYIQELDRNGHAVMNALTAAERTVKWHGSLIARALLSDYDLPLTVSVPEWSASLLSTAFQASKVEDVPLAQIALSAFLASIERSNEARIFVHDSGLTLLREIASKYGKNKHVQEALVRVLGLLYDGNMHLSLEESQKWSGILLRWVFHEILSESIRASSTKLLSYILEDHGPDSIPISQGWLAIMLNEILGASKTASLKGNSMPKSDKVKSRIEQSTALAAAQVVNQLAIGVIGQAKSKLESDSDSTDQLPLADFLSLEPFGPLSKNQKGRNQQKLVAADLAFATLKGIKALTELCSEDSEHQKKLVDFGMLCLLKRLLVGDDYEKLAANETYDASRAMESQDRPSTVAVDKPASDSNDSTSVRVPPAAHIRRHAAQLLTVLSLLPNVKSSIAQDEMWCEWLESCASHKISCCTDPKIQSYARATLLNVFCSENIGKQSLMETEGQSACARYKDMLFLISPELPHWKCSERNALRDSSNKKESNFSVVSSSGDGNGYVSNQNCGNSDYVSRIDVASHGESPLIDVVFVHGLRGGPFKSWRMADDKVSTTSKDGLVEHIDQEAGKEGTFWPGEWLSADFPQARLFTLRYKTKLTRWTGASLPLQEVSSMLLDRLLVAGIGDRPIVFVTHSMGGLVVKQMLYQAKLNKLNKFLDNTVGIIFYSCPHFGSKLADMPWRMGLILRPAPTIGELRSGSPRLVELNDFIRHLHSKGYLEVLSFSETQVTPIVEGYGGWAFRLEIVPMESAYPGFGELVVLDATDHINSCKPVNRTDPSYAETLKFLKKLKDRVT
ncbi:hypothetical protein IEQ34_017789 [Dendrobium chrysotoxum]|uniref:Protein SERAC1 n=1 Tax=Dendrobium chrysotoxum TaxID=161865 RepID=A0AAV7FUR0_DENCH|nr:hypothetical protein IEQ34_017789 [Dendrobium chrysotoxum]